MLSKFAKEKRYPPAFYRRLLRHFPPEFTRLMEFEGRSAPRDVGSEQPYRMEQLTQQLQNLCGTSERHEIQKLEPEEPKPGTLQQRNPDDELAGPSSEVKVSGKRARGRRNQKRKRELARKLAQMQQMGVVPTGFESDSCEDLEKCLKQLRLDAAAENVNVDRVHKRRRRKHNKKSRNKRRLQSNPRSVASRDKHEYYRSQPMPGMGGHHHQGMMMNGPRGNGPPMNGPPMNGPMGNPMGPHMMTSPNGPMHGPIPGPIPSPINNIGPSPMSGPMQGNGPINGPMMSPMGPMNNGGPMGPMSSPLNGPMNGPINGPGPMNGMSSPMNGPMSNQINGMGGGMNSPMGGPSQCPMNHVSSNSGGMNNNFMMPMNNIYQKPLPVSAGKVYPADQPMVFNSQNPNAPPIYPCGVCHKEVHDNDQAILCESGCNFWFHRGCTGLTEAAFQLLTAEVYAEWVCDKCLASKNIPLVKFKP